MICNAKNLLSEHKYTWQDLFFIALADAAVLASALHFWPFEDTKIWQMLNIPNLCCGLALIVVVFLIVAKKYRYQVFSLPHISVTAYLTINICSIAFADSLSRPLNYTLKLGLVLIGGLFLFQKAMSNPKTLRLFYILIAVAASISIAACIYTRLACDIKQFGFHGNVFKYGTYIGILIPLASIYLLAGSRWQVFWALLIVIGGVFSAGSMGAIITIFVGLFTGFVLARKPPTRTYILICLLLSVAGLFFSNKVFDGAIYQDFDFRESDGINLRQRYIEWQAEISLLEKRGITGTGAGCVNDYRSYFYYRLPKLNTLKAFDQNGFTAVAAETGLIGIVTFIWILTHYSRMSFRNYLSLKTGENLQSCVMAAANAAGLVSALIANLFSSVHYNGNLIIFVLLLSLISSVNRIYGGYPGED